jgi:hypothetical protein
MIAQAYRYIVDHLTKALGAVGAALMSLAAIDPEPIRQAAQVYLGQHAAAKVAAVLFGLVILRGWYTGQKAKQVATLPAPAPEASR